MTPGKLMDKIYSVIPEARRGQNSAIKRAYSTVAGGSNGRRKKEAKAT